MLEEAGLIDQREGRFELTPRGIRALGQQALGDLFRKLMKNKAGRHEVERTGVGHERAYEHKPYEFGDPFHLNVEQTVKNAIWRQGAGTPVRLSPERLRGRAHRAAHPLRHRAHARRVARRCRSATTSSPAKKVAMALHSLITTQFPRDYFGLVALRTGRPRGASRELLPEMSWDFEWGTNMQHTMLLARRSSAARAARSRSSWSPTASRPPTSSTARRYFQYPPSPITIEETLQRSERCTREGIRINTFMLDETHVPPGLRRAA